MGTVDRADAGDLAFLAMSRGRVPNQFAAVLLLAPAPGFDVAAARALLDERTRSVPRLRQRLRRPPPGCGRPYWSEDESFDVRRHVRHVTCPAPGDLRQLLGVVTDVVTTPLRRHRPMWRVAVVTGLRDERVALVVVVNHAVADGIGGLAVLAALADPGPPPLMGTDAAAHAARPTVRRLAADAWADRLAAVRRAGRGWRDLRAGMSAGGGWLPHRAAPCSLLVRTGPARRVAVVTTDLAPLRAAAHRLGATANDGVLVAVAAALRRVLDARGEAAETINVAVPVAARRATTTATLGNQVAPLLVAVPTGGSQDERVRRVAAATRAGKAAATGPAPITVLGPVFRAAARLGAYHWYQRHQHRIHTLVSTVRGPERRLAFAGHPIAAIIPVAVAEAGNVTVSFTVLSYAGTLTVTAVADPHLVPDLPALAAALAAELDRLAGAGSNASPRWDVGPWHRVAGRTSVEA